MKRHTGNSACVLLVLFAFGSQALRQMDAETRDITEMKIPGATLGVEFAPGDFDLPRADLMHWITRASTAVAAYYGHFPVPHPRLLIVPVAGERGIVQGTTWGRGGGFIRIRLGQHTQVSDLNEDWEMTHEMIHLAFPSVSDEHHWIEEGISTYVEPVARAQAGQLLPEQVWRDMIRDMPKGEPETSDLGLDRTHTWGRTYWGGAMFCLMADVRIRERTNNRRSLQDALRGILDAGGDIRADWPIQQAFETGDRETGVPVLMELYREMGDSPAPVDLPKLWQQLGVALHGKDVQFNDKAPLSRIRESMMAAPQK